MTIRIVTDSTCDLPAQLVQKYQISVLPVYVNIQGRSYKDGVQISRQDFYTQLPLLKELPNTSAPSVDDFRNTYLDLAQQGSTGIISIHIATSLSAVANTARIAAKSIKEVPIRVIDSGQLTLGLGLLVLKASRLAEEGAALEQIETGILDQAERTWSFALLDTLEYLRRGGRMSLIQYEIGRILNIKAMLIFHKGEMRAEKVFTMRGAIKRTFEYIHDKLQPVERLALIHAAAEYRIAELKQAARSLIKAGQELLVGEVTPAIGAHVGPGGLGVICVQAKGA
jgi:DegV family protein with EDD domain